MPRGWWDWQGVRTRNKHQMTQHDDTADREPSAGASGKPPISGTPAATDLPAAESSTAAAPGNEARSRDQQPQPTRQAPQQQPRFPSPYLEAGQSVPEAYLAPPQQGMPSYGSSQVPRGFGQGPLGFGQPPAGQQPNGQQLYQQYGQSPAQQRRYGPPRTGGRPAPGMGRRPLRDPALAAGWERLLAALLDWLLIFAVSVLAFISPLLRIWHQLEQIANSYPDLTSPGAQSAVDTFARSPATVSTLLHFWLAVFGIALAYYWVMHAVWGATLGKRVLGVAVVKAADRVKIGAREAGIRAVAFLVGPAIFVLIARIDYLGGILWLSDNGLLLLDARAQCLHDKLAGTVVIRRRRQQQQQQQTRQPRPW